MSPDKLDISKLRVAKPCPVPWESMTGDDRARKCDSCQLSIFNIEAMAPAEVETLVSELKGRLCIRLVRRADGTVMTRDCPVGLRGCRKRVASFVAASFGALLSLFSISFARQSGVTVLDAASISTTVERIHSNDSSQLKGILTDPNGAVIPNMRVRLFVGKEKKPLKETSTDTEGRFAFPNLNAGTYRIEIPKSHGFKRTIMENVVVEPDKDRTVSIALEPGEASVTVGIYTEEPMIDMSVAGPTPTVITRKMIDRIPGGRPF